MKKLSLIALLMILSACGRNGVDGKDGTSGFNGQNGTNGIDGVNGLAGDNGYNSLVSLVAGANSCSNGGTTLLTGLDLNRNNSLDTLEVMASAQICNGQNGADGEDGVDGEDASLSGFTPIALVNPCGDAPGVYDEIFIKLANGTLIASFSENANGKNTRFVILTAGTYQTTDGDNCVFTLNNSGTITYESHSY